MIGKHHPEILHFEVIDVIHAKCQNRANQIFTILKTLYPLVILPYLILFIFLLPLILYLRRYLLRVLLFPKAVRLYITNNRCQIVCLIYQIKPFGRVKNRSVTQNIAINQFHPYFRNPLQIPITNSILYYVTCDEFQGGWIEQRILIFSGINIKIVTDGSYPIPPHYPCPKITHILEELLMCLLILFKYMCE